MKENSLQKNTTVNDFKGTIPNSYNLYNNNSTFFSYLYLSLAGNIIVYPPNQVTNKEKYFNHNFYKGTDADSGGK